MTGVSFPFFIRSVSSAKSSFVWLEDSIRSFLSLVIDVHKLRNTSANLAKARKYTPPGFTSLDVEEETFDLRHQ